MTPEESAAEWEIMLDMAQTQVGTIQFTFGGIPSYGLPLDGGSYDGADYPDLFSCLPPQYKGPGNTFTLPDMTGRFIMGGLPTGQTGGEVAHTLSIDEMPVHSHGSHYHAAGLGGDVPGAAGVDIAGDTGSAGAAQPHENRPPFVTVNFYIIAE